MNSESTDPILAQMLHHRANQLEPGDPLPPPVVNASTYFLPGSSHAKYQYGRWDGPTWTALESALGVLEQADTAVFPSGMAAISAVLLTYLSGGDRVLLPSDGYAATRAVAERFLATAGVEVDTCSTREFGQRDLAGYSVVFMETPSNPLLDVCDIQEVARRAHAAGALVVVDNTTATPLGQRPLDLGADVIVASDTKALNGHSDVLAGHVSSRVPGVMERVREWRTLAGGIPGQFEAWLVHRGLETLDVRFERMCVSAQALAELFAEYSDIVSVRYPGVKNHPQRKIVERQMLRPGCLVGVTFADADTAEEFIAKSRFIIATTSFGGTHTTAERRAQWGDVVEPGFVRLSVGCEPTEELRADMERVLNELLISA